jgi:DNA-binding beta-propeller fold protein YncE
VRYVGELRKAKDLKPPVSFFKALGRIFAGSEPPQPLYGPRAVVCSRDGQRVWIADPGGRCLHMFGLEDRAYRQITCLGDVQLLSPVGICLGDGESIYVCDSENGSVHRLSDRTGALLEEVRVGEDLGRPVALAYDSSVGELYVVDVVAHNIKVVDRDGHLIRLIGRRGTGPGEFNFPCGIADDGERIWVVDTGNHRVQGLTRAGEPEVEFGQVGDAPGDLALPKGVAVDSQGHLYVVDARFENVQIFDREGRLLLSFGEEGNAAGEFWLPSGIHVDSTDRIWVCDSYGRRVQVFEFVNTRDKTP